MIAGYPVVLRLHGRRAVVVGGGSVAARKIIPLLRAGADVVVVAPAAEAAVERLAASATIVHVARPFEPADLDGAFLAVAATDNPGVNQAVAAAARERGVLVNVADDPAACDFTVPATVRRGSIALAISTGGRSPAFARYLREQLDDWLTDARCAMFELLAEVRRDVRAAGLQLDGTAWRHAIDDDAVIRAIEAGDRDGARRRIFASLMAGQERGMSSFP